MDPADRASLAAELNRVRRRWGREADLSLIGRAGAALALIVAAAAMAARVASTDSATLAIAAACAFAVAVLITGAVLHYRRRPDDARMARYLEERCPELEDTVAAAVHVTRHPSRSPLAPAVVYAAVGRLRTIDLDRVVSADALRAAAVRAVLAAAAVGLAVVLAVPLALHTIETVRARFFPRSVTVSVRPGDSRLVSGQPLVIAARLDAGGAPMTRIVPEVELEAGGEIRSVPMHLRGSEYELRIENVDRSFRYRVHAGRAMSSGYTVTALVAPRVQAVDLRYEYPAFTGLRPRDDQDGGDIYAPKGTRVRVRVHADKPIVAGRVTLDGSALPSAQVDARTFESLLTLRQDGSYRVAVADADGLQGESVEYFVRLVADRPPEIHIVRPTGDQEITPLEEVTIEARADDDFGIASMDMVFSVAGGPEHVVPFTALTGTETARVGSRLMAAEELGVKPGDVISYYARARDVAHAKASSLAHSEIFFLEVKPFNEEYSLAQSQAMAAATGTELEGLIAAQKEVISATWNLERRSGAGSSSADIKNVAGAQAEVKARAERAAGTVSPRRRGVERMFEQFGRPSQPQDGAGDAVAEAAAAMGRALQHLNAGTTKEAISPEMAALNALLKAQAAIRQRQITQQRNGSSSFGNGRQGQDLSNLFDRELKRQQRTNYETESQIERPGQQTDDDQALDRIRELARRQEDLARQQQDLASANGSDEERRRQLERLTREQEELRRQLEEMSRRQAGQSSSSAGASGQSGSSGAAQGAMRDALEQMRQAASELQRQNASSAAQRATEAARQLQGAAGEMQGRSADARRRELGDLQLESRQIADAQRRLAEESARLDRDGAAAADARRKLAAEQEQLAERLGRLKDQAARLGSDKSAPAESREAASGAAQAIGGQQLDKRMRDTAKTLRGARKPAGADAQQIADALDRVARGMSSADAGGAKGETGQLADQLDQVREARERLARLQQQIDQLRKDAARGRSTSPGQAGREGREGQRGQNGSQGDGQGSGELTRAQDEYARELQRTQDLVNRLERGKPDSSRGQSTPEEHEWSRSAPGTEAWKQDFAKWEALGKDISQRLERTEGTVAARLSKSLERDRLAAAGSERIPDSYAERAARYFESLAKVKKP